MLAHMTIQTVCKLTMFYRPISLRMKFSMHLAAGSIALFNDRSCCRPVVNVTRYEVHL